MIKRRAEKICREFDALHRCNVRSTLAIGRELGAVYTSVRSVVIQRWIEDGGRESLGRLVAARMLLRLHPEQKRRQAFQSHSTYMPDEHAFGVSISKSCYTIQISSSRASMASWALETYW